MVRRLLCTLLVAAALLAATAAPLHEEAPVISVNGTFNTHFSARVTDIQPGGCVLFEAQVGVLAAAYRPHALLAPIDVRVTPRRFDLDGDATTA